MMRKLELYDYLTCVTRVFAARFNSDLINWLALAGMWETTRYV